MRCGTAMSVEVTVPGRTSATQITAILAEIMAAPHGELDVQGFWRLFGGGGQCVLYYDRGAAQWHGTLADHPGSESRHAPVACSFSTERVADFLRLADCRRDSLARWIARYCEPS